MVDWYWHSIKYEYQALTINVAVFETVLEFVIVTKNNKAYKVYRERDLA